MDEKKKHIFKVIILLAITALVIVAKNYYYSWPAAVALLVVLFCISSFGEWVAYSVYMSVFSCVSPIYVSTLVLMVIMTAGKYVIDVRNKRQKVYPVLIIATLAILLLWTLNITMIDLEGFYQWALVGGIMIFAYFLFIYYREVDIKKCFNTLLQALFLSSILYIIFRYIGFMTSQIGTIRLQLFTININCLSIYASFGIAYQLTHIMTDLKTKTFKQMALSRKFLFEILTIVFLFVIGIHTLSKSFLIVFNFMLFYFDLFLLMRYKWRGIPVALLITVVVGLAQYAFSDEVVKIVQRFIPANLISGESRTDSNTISVDQLLSVVFTARPEIWSAYLSFSTASIFNLLFGAGLLASPVSNIGPHNTFLFLLHRFGLIGILFICVLIYYYIKQSNVKIKFTYSKVLLLVLFVLFSFEEMMLMDRVFIFTILGYLMLLSPNTDKPDDVLVQTKTKIE